MVDEQNPFDQLVKNDLKTYDNIKKLQLIKEIIIKLIVCQIIFIFKRYFKMIAIDLRKQQVLNADAKATQQINFDENLDQYGKKTMLFIVEEEKEPFQAFHSEL